jgi:hypothetical protein
VLAQQRDHRLALPAEAGEDRRLVGRSGLRVQCVDGVVRRRAPQVELSFSVRHASIAALTRLRSRAGELAQLVGRSHRASWSPNRPRKSSTSAGSSFDASTSSEEWCPFVEPGLHQRADLLGQRLGFDGQIGHAVDQVGDVLAFQRLDGVEVAVGRPDVAGDHGFGVRQVVEAVGVGAHEGGDERVAGEPPGSTDPLDVAGGLRGTEVSMTAERSPMSMPISSVGVAVITLGASGAVPALNAARGLRAPGGRACRCVRGDDAAGGAAAVEVAVVVGLLGDVGSYVPVHR